MSEATTVVMKIAAIYSAQLRLKSINLLIPRKKN